MKYQKFWATTCLFGSLGLSITAARADDLSMGGIDGSITGSVGFRNISAGEFAFDEQTMLNRLDWQIHNAPMVKSEVIANLSKNWTLKAEFSAAFLGEGEETNRSYTYGFSDNSGPESWDGKFYSPNTKLDYFLQAGIEADRTIYESDDLQISAGPGFKYTDFQMTASGGADIYSTANFLDTTDLYPDSTKIVRYRQQIPVGFLALNAEKTLGGLTFSGGLQAGAAVRYRDTDDHFLSDRHFDDDIGFAPYLGLNAKANYDINDRTSFFAAASYETVLRTRGDTTVFDGGAGTSTDYANAAGASMQTWAVSAGVKVRF